MSAKHIRNTGDLMRFRASIRIDCSHCAAARTMSGLETVRAMGVTSFEEAETRLRCTRCGGKGARVSVLPPV